ncbi:MAG: hypothetical protein OXG10_07095 [Candidatus Dadabacteria bacterium]|nr:hypothetical protein [Candidatus Dadabacteria bacterium]
MKSTYRKWLEQHQRYSKALAATQVVPKISLRSYRVNFEFINAEEKPAPKD